MADDADRARRGGFRAAAGARQHAYLNSVSCIAGGACAAAGLYADAWLSLQAGPPGSRSALAEPQDWPSGRRFAAGRGCYAKLVSALGREPDRLGAERGI